MTHGSLTILDYVLLALSCFFVILGLFRGASGVFSFIAASVISFSTGVFIWEPLCSLDVPSWAHFVIAIVLGLIVFGIVRLIVKKLVNSLLAQPADSIFGLLLGLATSVLLVYVAAGLPLARENSVIAREASSYIKAGQNVR